jgi:hypothetical protein
VVAFSRIAASRSLNVGMLWSPLSISASRENAQ